jgi:hypothetical protein
VYFFRPYAVALSGSVISLPRFDACSTNWTRCPWMELDDDMTSWQEEFGIECPLSEREKHVAFIADVFRAGWMMDDGYASS